MPELAEVEYFRRQWQPGVGRPVLGVELHPEARVFRGCDTSGLSKHLSQAVLQESFSHGKNLLFGFSSGGWLGLHLGMTGEMRVETGAPPATRHDHLVLRQPGQSLVFADSRMFGRVRFDVSNDQPPSWWRALPPALLSRGFSEASVAECLRRRSRSPIKAVLLDQSVFPGIGNWMADEILWRLRLHPLTFAGALSVDQSHALHRQTQWVARRALATIGVDWRDPPVAWLYRHRWAAGTRCPRPACRAPLLRAETAGRTTCWCPVCQPAPPTTESRPATRPVGTGRRRETPVRRTTGRG
jgi:formamidopyrimidine-DNA glycosylase